MIILGINYFYHDSSACLLKDGKLLIAVEEERFSREKHSEKFPLKAIAQCLQYAKIDYADIDHIAVSISPKKDYFKKILYALKLLHRSPKFVFFELLMPLVKEFKIKKWYKENIAQKGFKAKFHFVPHHLSHIAGSYYVSPYDEAALLSIDGAGEWSTSLLGYAKGNKITTFNESNFPMSIGSFYELPTQFCGFKANYDEGKTMGLAPMGNDKTYTKQIAELLKIKPDGGIDLDLSYFQHQYFAKNHYSKKFLQAFGQPRDKHGEFEQNHLDIAAAFQKVLEQRVKEMCAILYQKTQCKKLVIAGGVALNSVMNGEIIRNTDFEELYVMPAAGDNGTSIGAAFYVYNNILGQAKTYIHDNPFIGNEYSNEEIKTYLDQCKLQYEYVEDIESYAAKLLHQGFIIGWHQGRMEIGPRALGNRSILANPTLATMKDKINAEVKHREAYRPFAPSAISECVNDYFEDLGDNPFMLKVCDVLPDAREKLPAITHVDGTGRLQTVYKSSNPGYHKLIEEFGKLSGVPVLLNTSFNIMGEPVVESPLHALRCFYSTGLDYLVIGNYVLHK